MNERDGSQPPVPKQDGDANNQVGALGDAASPTRTPMYRAIHAARYERQTFIKRIQEESKSKLVCYVSGSGAFINRDDTLGFVDLLHNVESGKNIDLLLHTPGGNIDAAEKLMSMVHRTAGTGRVRIIVPDFAKSAGTLMALGADRIIMSDSSELGPIDPQITLDDGHGNLIQHSVQSYLDAYKFHSESVRKNPDDVAARIMLGKIEPATVKLFEGVSKRTRQLAERHLKRAGLINFTEIAEKLMSTETFPSHGQMIGWQDAKVLLGSIVEYLDPKDDKWQPYWQLYCLQRLAVKDREKLFESDYASFPIDGSP